MIQDDRPGLSNPDSEKSFLGQVFSFGFVQAIIQVRSLITLPILARLLGPNGYGSIAPVIATVTLVQAFVLLGANSALTIYIPGRHGEQKRAEFWGIAQLTAVLSFVYCALLIALFPLLKPVLFPESLSYSLFIIGLVLVPANSIQLVLYAQIVNNQDGRSYSRTIGISSLAEIVLTVSATLAFGVAGYLAAMAVSKFFLSYLMIRIILRQDSFVPLRKTILRPLLKYYRYGLILFFAGFAADFVASSDRIILAKLVSSTEVGTYDLVYGMLSKLNHLGAPMFSTLMAFVVSSLAAGNLMRARRYLEQTIRILLFIFIPAVALVSMTAQDIILVLTTDEFLAGAQLFLGISVGIAIWQVAGVYTYTLHAHQKGHWVLGALLVGSFVNLGLNLWLVPYFGAIASAWATMASYLIVMFVCAALSRRLIRIDWDLPFLAKALLGGTVLAVVIFLIQSATSTAIPFIRLFLSIAGGSTAYLLCIRLTQALSQDEINQLVRIASSVLRPVKIVPKG